MKPSSTWLNILTVCKCKSVRIHDQEHSKIIQGISSWVPVPIKSLILMKNMSPKFDGILEWLKTYSLSLYFI